MSRVTLLTAQLLRRGRLLLSPPAIGASFASQAQSKPASGQASGKGKQCWKCKAILPVHALICTNGKCGAVVPLSDHVNYFDVLVGTPTFDIDVQDVRKRFLRAQQQTHPDNFSVLGEMDRRMAETQSSWLNRAYNTLKNPYERAKYMLELQGIYISEEESIQEPEFLEQVFEINEALDDAVDKKAVKAIKVDNDERIKHVSSQLSEAFEQSDLMEARILTIKLRYWDNVKDIVDNWAPTPVVNNPHTG
ncbi:molecular chaperone [Dimargaris verticillata]|uniref:Molecular chaperone n=1 Tax=Dimargaris verticillata TaxID=2761393 RepID=A0A9W8EEV3_9FUNG|nr:molecular chaperone [Dimargaris verticillata]